MQNLTPLERYRYDLQQPGFFYDKSQNAAVGSLQELYELLVAQYESERDQSGGLLARLGRRLSRQSVEPIRGLYFWGGVGRGKTYLMDNFFECLPFENRLRTHFHRFMRRVHRELKSVDGEKNPLEIVADRIVRKTRVICFDEFSVSDITDAMILGTLLEHLFAKGVTLVTTSNIPPDELYRDGLQRQRFLPAIALIKQHTRIINVDGGVDYRLRALTRAELYHSPLGDGADRALLGAFESLVPNINEVRQNVALEVEGRPILARQVGEDVVWFDFPQLCDGPRSQNDYLELAREFHAVLIGNVPGMGRGNDDQARRFINLVDVFYDRNVKLVLSAARPLEQLYSEGRLEFEFQRTLSRLLEMQSREYLARPHRP